MSRFHSLPAVLTSGVVAAALLAAPGAVARSYQPSTVVLRDGPGDVWRFDPQTEQSTRLKSFPLADVTQAAVTHGRDALMMRMRFVDIRRVGTQLYWTEIRTPAYHFQAVVTSKPGNRQGSRYFQGDDGSKSCQGFTRRIDYRNNTVDLRVPRSCLHNPRWVRVGIYNEVYFKQSGPNYFDNPFNHRSPVQQPGETQRLYRSQG